MEILSKLRLGSKKTEQAYPDPSEDPVINSLVLERNHALLVLMYLLPPSLSRSQVESLSYQLYEDALRGQVRPLYKVALAAELFPERGGLENNPFLNHVGLKYRHAEMERVFNELDPTKKYDDPEDGGTLADTLAGGGPPRPLLKELYRFHDHCLVDCVTRQGEEKFYLTRGFSGGLILAEAINSNVSHCVAVRKRHDFLMVVGSHWDKREILPLPSHS